jgi:hypothetical protein
MYCPKGKCGCQYFILLTLTTTKIITGRKVRERKLSSLMKKMKESGKLDINKRLTILCQKISSPEVKRKQYGGDRYYANIRA